MSRLWSTTFAMVTFNGKYQPLINVVLQHFSLALTVFRYSHFKIRDLENLDLSHDVQCCHSMANTFLIVNSNVYSISHHL